MVINFVFLQNFFISILFNAITFSMKAEINKDIYKDI